MTTERRVLVALLALTWVVAMSVLLRGMGW
jgi:hypothetical protein